jgi:valyl-tRNA synthetase
MENIHDWCISRQLWWGHRIPAWYLPDGSFAVAETREDAWRTIIKRQSSNINNDADDTTGRGIANLASHVSPFSINDLRQDDDVLDTWFSAWLWPFEVFKGLSKPGNDDIKYYYPTHTLVTAPEIIFFWVARMIMAGFEFMGERPFRDVYFTGIVRDKLGRKMSKSLGNSPDLLMLIDKYGADAVRFGIILSSPAGNDLMFDEASLEQGRNFNNKLWNALKLVKMWGERKAESEQDGKTERPEVGKAERREDEKFAADTGNFAVNWFESRLNEARAEVDELMKQFKLSEALKTIYSLIWDDFCSWYLEWVKPGFEQPIDAEIFEKTVDFFDELMQLLHPYMPFITEDVYHQLRERNHDLCVRQYTEIKQANSKILSEAELLKKVITALRDARSKNQLKPKDAITLHIQTASNESYTGIEKILAKQVNAPVIQFAGNAVPNTIIVAVETDKFYIETEKQLDTASLKDELLKDLAYQNNFLQSVLKKLSNERFVQNAKPDVVELERKKQADAEARIKTIEESLANL